MLNYKSEFARRAEILEFLMNEASARSFVKLFEKVSAARAGHKRYCKINFNVTDYLTGTVSKVQLFAPKQRDCHEKSKIFLAKTNKIIEKSINKNFFQITTTYTSGLQGCPPFFINILSGKLFEIR